MILTLELMILTLGLLWSILCSSECENEMLHQPLTDLSIGCLEVGISDVRASNVVPSLDDQTKRWRPWLEIMIPE